MSSNSPPPQYPQQGYSPQQGVQQGGYVPQQGGYVPPQGGYVPQYVQGGYSPQPQYQGGVPLQQQPQQPQVFYTPTTQMSTPQVIANQAPIVGAPREWKFGLFDCFADCGLCLKTCCCPCITYGETKAKVNKDPGSCCCNSFLYCCFMYVGIDCILGALNRNEMRAKYNIDGSGCGDFCTHVCCGCCALIQENREANSIP